jgi:hypothetical protein
MSLDINKQKMTYALPTGQQPKYELDSDGNIAYEGYMGEDGLFVPYLDDDGNKIPKLTGDTIDTYLAPVNFYSSINNKLNEVLAKEFGIDDSTNYAQLVTDKEEFPLKVGALIWKKSEVVYAVINGEPMVDATTADYTVKGVADEGLTVDLYLLQKNVKNAE